MIKKHNKTVYDIKKGKGYYKLFIFGRTSIEQFKSLLLMQSSRTQQQSCMACWSSANGYGTENVLRIISFIESYDIYDLSTRKV